MIASLTPEERISVLRLLASRNDEHDMAIAEALSHPAVKRRFSILWDEFRGADRQVADFALFELVHGIEKFTECGPCLAFGVVRESTRETHLCSEHELLELVNS